MAFWLVKSDPDSYSWESLIKDKKTVWDGVRNYQARNNLMKMEVGDLVFVYESQSTKYIAGLAEVSKSSFPDPSADDDRWVAIELSVVRSLENRVTLENIKAADELKNIALIKQSRLSVMPLTSDEFNIIIKLSQQI